MSHIEFPPVHLADENGLLGVGGDPTVENLLEAYKRGIFPWPWSEEYVAWFAPDCRAVLDFSTMHISRTLKKFLKHNPFTVRIDTAFEQVIENCKSAPNRKKQKGSWITPALQKGYCDLHRNGHAHSFEVFKDQVLVGGLYGVSLGRYFSGESMFHLEDNASKVALVAAVRFLSGFGVTWMDCQVINHLTEKFGAEEVFRDEFMTLLSRDVHKTGPEWIPGATISLK